LSLLLISKVLHCNTFLFVKPEIETQESVLSFLNYYDLLQKAYLLNRRLIDWFERQFDLQSAEIKKGRIILPGLLSQ
jgi:hypothetical protein